MVYLQLQKRFDGLPNAKYEISWNQWLVQMLFFFVPFKGTKGTAISFHGFSAVWGHWSWDGHMDDVLPLFR